MLSIGLTAGGVLPKDQLGADRGHPRGGALLAVGGRRHRGDPAAGPSRTRATRLAGECHRRHCRPCPAAAGPCCAATCRRLRARGGPDRRTGPGTLMVPPGRATAGPRGRTGATRGPARPRSPGAIDATRVRNSSTASATVRGRPNDLVACAHRRQTPVGDDDGLRVPSGRRTLPGGGNPSRPGLAARTLRPAGGCRGDAGCEVSALVFPPARESVALGGQDQLACIDSCAL